MRLLCLLAVASCFPVAVENTSRTFLGVDQSHAFVRGNLTDVSLEVVRMFGERKLGLVDQHPTMAGVELVFRGERTTVTSGGRYSVSSVDVGSEFVASLRAMPGGLTEVELVGRPLFDGTQPYAMPDSDLDHLRVSGAEEADVVHGVFSELALAGRIERPRDAAGRANAAMQRPTTALEQCMAERHAVFERARRITNAPERARIYESAPTCSTIRQIVSRE